jgi:hypothetical protein
MSPLIHLPSIPALAATLALLMFTPAVAQTGIKKKAIDGVNAAVSKIESACKKDVSAYCNQVTSGEGRIAFCMLAHEDKVSDGCYDTILDVGEDIRLSTSNVLRAAQACGADIEKYCGSARAGEGRIAACLNAKESELSRSCKAEIAGLKTRMSSKR